MVLKHIKLHPKVFPIVYSNAYLTCASRMKKITFIKKKIALYLEDSFHDYMKIAHYLEDSFHEKI